MKLTFTQEELLAGAAERRLSEKRRDKIIETKVTVGAFSLEPIPLNGETATGVIVSEIESVGDDRYTLKMKPVSCRVFEVYASGVLRQLTLDLPKQVTITDGGVRETRMTLAGPGIDKARVAFGRLITDHAGSPIVRAMVAHLSK